MYTKYKVLNSSNRITLNLWFIKLRWIAIVVSSILIFVSTYIHKFLPAQGIIYLLPVILLIIASNIFYIIILKKKIFFRYLEKIQIFFDLLFISLILQFSGGIENPLSLIYLLHVILSGILLSKIDCYKVVFIATFLYALVSLGELYRILPHYTLLIYPHTDNSKIIDDEKTLDLHDHEYNEHNLIHAAHYPLYVWSMIGLNFFLMFLTAYFITTIMEWLRNEEKESREKFQWLEKVLQATGAGLLILNDNFTSAWMNKPIKNWLNIKGSVEEKNLVISEWVKGKFNEVSKTFKDGKTRTIELNNVLESGQKQYFQITIATLYNTEGKIYQVVELVQNITAKKLIEAEMLHASKMATVGIMAASISHEVGNPLSSISTRLKLLESKKETSFVNESIPLLQKEIARINRIVRGISQFGKPGKETWGECNINFTIKETVELLKYHKTSKKCEIILKLKDDLPNTLASQDQLKQVFLNLGLNAFDAMENSGTLTIETNYEKGNILIKFTDTGLGIKQELLDKIFNPFFSTKEHGSGLGLFIVYHIIQSHGGEMNATSEVGKGSSFIIYLPIQLIQRNSDDKNINYR